MADLSERIQVLETEQQAIRASHGETTNQLKELENKFISNQGALTELKALNEQLASTEEEE